MMDVCIDVEVKKCVEEVVVKIKVGISFVVVVV